MGCLELAFQTKGEVASEILNTYLEIMASADLEGMVHRLKTRKQHQDSVESFGDALSTLVSSLRQLHALQQKGSMRVHEAEAAVDTAYANVLGPQFFWDVREVPLACTALESLTNTVVSKTNNVSLGGFVPMEMCAAG